MGINTKAVVIGTASSEDIFRVVLDKIDSQADLDTQNRDDYHRILFKDPVTGSRRKLGVFSDCHCDYRDLAIGEGDSLLLDLGHFDSSVQIMEDILSQYGGWIKGNDCADEWRYVDYTGNLETLEPKTRLVVELTRAFGNWETASEISSAVDGDPVRVKSVLENLDDYLENVEPSAPKL